MIQKTEPNNSATLLYSRRIFTIFTKSAARSRKNPRSIIREACRYSILGKRGLIISQISPRRDSLPATAQREAACEFTRFPPNGRNVRNGFAPKPAFSVEYISRLRNHDRNARKRAKAPTVSLEKNAATYILLHAFMHPFARSAPPPPRLIYVSRARTWVATGAAILLCYQIRVRAY